MHRTVPKNEGFGFWRSLFVMLSRPLSLLLKQGHVAGNRCRVTQGIGHDTSPGAPFGTTVEKGAQKQSELTGHAGSLHGHDSRRCAVLSALVQWGT